MKNSMRLLSSILLVCALSFLACGKEKGDMLLLPLGGGSSGDTVVNIAAIPGVVVPVRGETPVVTPLETEQYFGIITWSPNDNPFEPETAYTAYIALTSKSGFTLNGVAANFFTVAGADSVTNSADSNVVSAVFPETGGALDIEVLFLSAEQFGGTFETADSTGFTLTFDVDPATLTADDITVTGATKGVLSGTGKTRTLAISNITVANGASVTVTITSPAGFSIIGSPRSSLVYRLLAVGQPYQGGIIAYIYQSGDPGYVTGETHGIIAATSDQSTGIIWAVSAYQSTSVPGGTGTALGTGSVNTDNIIFQNGAGNTYAAGLARAYQGGHYTDWYLPSRDELDKLCTNRTAIGGFAALYYWSSSEYDESMVWVQYFNFELQSSTLKYDVNGVRAVRAF